MPRAALRRARSSWLNNGLDPAEMGILVLVAEPDFFAVRQEDERNVELIGIATALRLPGAQIDARALGFEHGERPPVAVEEGVIRLAAIIERIFETDAAAVRQPPIGIPQQLVDVDPREGLVRHAEFASLRQVLRISRFPAICAQNDARRRGSQSPLRLPRRGAAPICGISQLRA